MLNVNKKQIYLLFICIKLYVMAKKTLILTRKQLEEIVGGDTTYLDNAESDFTEDGANQVYTGEKTDTEDAVPVTTDKISKQLRRNLGIYGYSDRVRSNSPLVMTCSKSEWKKRNLIKETNSELVNTKFGIGQSVKDNMVATGDSAGANAVENGNITYDNAKMIKSRMNKLQQQAKKGDAQAAQTYQNMGGKLLHDTVEKKLDNATSMVKRDKENRSNMGFSNVYQKPGGTKNNGNASKSAIITYDE